MRKMHFAIESWRVENVCGMDSGETVEVSSRGGLRSWARIGRAPSRPMAFHPRDKGELPWQLRDAHTPRHLRMRVYIRALRHPLSPLDKPNRSRCASAGRNSPSVHSHPLFTLPFAKSHPQSNGACYLNGGPPSGAEG